MKRSNFTPRNLIVASLSVVGVLLLLVVVLLTRKNQVIEPNVMTQPDESIIAETPDNQEINIPEFKLSIVPEVVTDYGISLDTTFVLSVEQGRVDVDFLQNVLQIIPWQDYEIETIPDETGQYRIKLAEALAPGSTIKFRCDLNNQGWAFQTIEEFGIKFTYPLNDSEDIRVDESVVIEFTQEIPANANDYFEISPYIEGKLSYKGSTLTFKPDQPFEPATIYQVRILGSMSHDENVQDYLFEFATESMKLKNPELIFRENEILIPINEPAILNFESSIEGLINQTLDVTYYQLESYKDYIVALNRLNTIQDQDDFNEILSYTQLWSEVLQVNQGREEQSYYLILDTRLMAGYYIARVEVNGLGYYQLIQVSNYQGYVTKNEQGVMVHVVNNETKLPASNLYLYVNDNPYGITNDHGICSVGAINEKKNRNHYILKDNEGNELMISLEAEDLKLRKAADDQAIYMETNKKSYQSDELIDVVGYVDKGFIEATYLTMKVKHNYMAIQEIQIPISEQGSFEYIYYPKDYYLDELTFELWSDLSLLELVTVSIENKEVRAWLNLDIKTQMIIGKTPVDLELTLADSNLQAIADAPINLYQLINDQLIALETEDLVTDTNGFVKASVNLQSYEDDDNDSYRTIVAETVIDGIHIRRSSTVSQMQFDTRLNNSYELNKKNMIIKGSVTRYEHNIKIDQDPGLIPLIGQYITIEIYRVSVDDFFKGYVDNPYKNSLEMISEYQESFKKVDTLEVTSDQFGQFDVIYQGLETNREYLIKVATSDSKGNLVADTYRVYSDTGFVEDGMTDSKSLSIKTNQNTFEVGDTVLLDLFYDGIKVADDEENYVLYILSYNQRQSYVYSKSLSASFSFTEEMIPEVQVTGLYYNGNQLVELDGFSVDYEIEQQLLDVTIDLEDKIYKTGDSVTTQIKVTDFEGNTVIGAVYLNIVYLESDHYYHARSPVDLAKNFYKTGDVIQHNTGLLSYQGILKPSLSNLSNEETKILNDGVLISPTSKLRNKTKFNGETNGLGIFNFVFEIPEGIDQFAIEAMVFGENGEVGMHTIVKDVTDVFWIELGSKKEYQMDESININVLAEGDALEAYTNYFVRLINLDSDATTHEATYEFETKGYNQLSFGYLEVGTYEVHIEAINGKRSVQKQISLQVKEQLTKKETMVAIEVADDYNYKGDTYLDYLYVISSENRDAFEALYEIGQLRFYEDLYLRWIGNQGLNDLNSGFGTFFLEERMEAKTIMDPIIDDGLFMDTLLNIVWVDSSVINGIYKKVIVDKVKVIMYEQKLYHTNPYYYQGLAILAALNQPVLHEIQQIFSEDWYNLSLTNQLYILMGLSDFDDRENGLFGYRLIKNQYITGNQYLDRSDEGLVRLIGIASKLQLMEEADYWIAELYQKDLNLVYINQLVYYDYKDLSREATSFELTRFDETKTVTLGVKKALAGQGEKVITGGFIINDPEGELVVYEIHLVPYALEND